MSKRVHQINKKLAKTKSSGEAIRILAELQKTNPDLWHKVQNQPGK